VEAAEQAAAALQVGAAAPEAQEACGRPANRVRQPLVGLEAAVREAAELVQADLVVGTVAVVPVAAALAAAEEQAEALAEAVPVAAALAAAEDQVEALAEAAPVAVGRVVEAEPEELAAGPARPANRESGWPRPQCLREAC